MAATDRWGEEHEGPERCENMRVPSVVSCLRLTCIPLSVCEVRPQQPR